MRRKAEVLGAKRKGERTGHHRGLRAGHVPKGVIRELERAIMSPTQGGQKMRSTGDKQETWQCQAALSAMTLSRENGTQRRRKRGNGYWEAKAKSEATQEGQMAVAARHSTRETGEVRPKRPSGGKAKPGETF